MERYVSQHVAEIFERFLEIPAEVQYLKGEHGIYDPRDAELHRDVLQEIHDIYIEALDKERQEISRIEKDSSLSQEEKEKLSDAADTVTLGLLLHLLRSLEPDTWLVMYSGDRVGTSLVIPYYALHNGPQGKEEVDLIRRYDKMSTALMIMIYRFRDFAYHYAHELRHLEPNHCRATPGGT